jgi:hypothetical protein
MSEENREVLAYGSVVLQFDRLQSEKAFSPRVYLGLAR